MTLEEFEVKLRAQVDAFGANWREHHTQTPEDYPIGDEIGGFADWFEQFEVFNEKDFE